MSRHQHAPISLNAFIACQLLMCSDQISDTTLLARALRAAQQGHFTQAETELRSILAGDPANVEAKFGLATLLATCGRFSDAIDLFREVIHAKPDHPAALLNLGNALLQQGTPHDAEQSFRALLKLSPDSAPAIYGLGCALQHQGNATEAERCYRKALPSRPGDPGLWMNLGTVLRQLGQPGNAVSAYRKATQLKPDLFQAWSALGQTLLETHHFQDSEQAFRRALQLAPHNAEAEIGLGDTLYAQQHEDAALKCYRRAIELDSQSQNAHTKTEALLLHMAGTAGDAPLFTRLSSDCVYERPSDSLADALALLDAYNYPEPGVLERTRGFLERFAPEQLYPAAWWNERLSEFGVPAEGHCKVLRGICSAIYSWSAPSCEAIEAVANFAGDAVVHSFGAGSGYWEWLLTRHYGTRIAAGDQVLRHRFIEMTEEDYGTAVVRDGEVVFLAWIPRGVDAVMNLLRQMRAGQKLVLVGEGPDNSGKARICATETFFRQIESTYKVVGSVKLEFYSYIQDEVRLYQRL
ncbi:MAG: tetratricopeptide repeat protein [Sulfuricaulis sp.]